MSIERIVITLKPDGSFRGASAQDYDGFPVPLTEPALTALFPTLNAIALASIATKDATIAAKDTEKSEAVAAKEAEKDAVIAEKDAEKAALEADHAVAQSALSDIEAVLTSTPPEEIAARAAEILEKARGGKQTATDKEIAALEAQIAAEQAKLAELKGK